MSPLTSLKEWEFGSELNFNIQYQQEVQLFYTAATLHHWEFVCSVWILVIVLIGWILVIVLIGWILVIVLIGWILVIVLIGWILVIVLIGWILVIVLIGWILVIVLITVCLVLHVLFYTMWTLYPAETWQ